MTPNEVQALIKDQLAQQAAKKVALPVEAPPPAAVAKPVSSNVTSSPKLAPAPAPLTGTFSEEVARLQEPANTFTEEVARLQAPPVVAPTPTPTPTPKAPSFIEDIPGASADDLAKAEAELRRVEERVARPFSYGSPTADQRAKDLNKAAEQVRHIKAMREKGEDPIRPKGFIESAYETLTDPRREGTFGADLAKAKATGTTLPPESEKIVQGREAAIQEADARDENVARVAKENAWSHLGKTLTATGFEQDTTLPDVLKIREQTVEASLPNEAFLKAATDYIFKQMGGEDLSTTVELDANGEPVYNSLKLQSSPYNNARVSAREKAKKWLLSLRAEGQFYWPHSIAPDDLEDADKERGLLDYLEAWVQPSTEVTESGISVRTQSPLLRVLGMPFVANSVGAEALRGLLGGDTNVYKAVSKQTQFMDRVALDWRSLPQMVEWSKSNNPGDRMLFAQVFGSAFILDFLGPDLFTAAKYAGQAAKATPRLDRMRSVFADTFLKVLDETKDAEKAADAARTAAGNDALAEAARFEDEGQVVVAKDLRRRVTSALGTTPEGLDVQMALGATPTPAQAADEVPRLMERVADNEQKLADIDKTRKELGEAKAEALKVFDARAAAGETLDNETREAATRAFDGPLKKLQKEAAPLKRVLRQDKAAIESIESGAYAERYAQGSEQATKSMAEQAGVQEGGSVAARTVTEVFPPKPRPPAPTVSEDVVRAAFGDMVDANGARRVMDAKDIKAALAATRVKGKNTEATRVMAQQTLDHMAQDPELATVIANATKDTDGPVEALYRMLILDAKKLDPVMERSRNTAALAQLRADEAHARQVALATKGALQQKAEKALADAEAALDESIARKAGTEEANRLQARVVIAREGLDKVLAKASDAAVAAADKASGLSVARQAEAELTKRLEAAKDWAAPIAKPKKGAVAAVEPAPAAPVPDPAPSTKAVPGVPKPGTTPDTGEGVTDYALMTISPEAEQQRAERFNIKRLFFGASGEPFSRKLATFRPGMEFARRQRAHLLHLALQRDFAASQNNALWKYLGGPEARDFAGRFNLPWLEKPLTPSEMYTYRVSINGGPPVAYNPTNIRKRVMAGEQLTVEPVSLDWSKRAQDVLIQFWLKEGREHATTTNNWLRSYLPFSDPHAAAGEQGLVRVKDTVLVDDADVAKALGAYQLPTRDDPGVQVAFTGEVVGFKDGQALIQPYEYQTGKDYYKLNRNRKPPFPVVAVDAAKLEYMERGRAPRDGGFTRPMTDAEWLDVRALEDAAGGRSLSYRPEVVERMAVLNPPEVATLDSFMFFGKDMSPLDADAKQAVEAAEKAVFRGVPKPVLAPEAGAVESAVAAVPDATPKQIPVPEVGAVESVVAVAPDAAPKQIPAAWQAVQDAKAALLQAKKAVREAGDYKMAKSLHRLVKSEERLRAAQAAEAAAPQPAGPVEALQTALEDARTAVAVARNEQRKAAQAAAQAAGPVMQRIVDNAQAALELALSAHEDVKALRNAADKIESALAAALGQVQDTRRAAADHLSQVAKTRKDQELILRRRSAFKPAPPHTTPARAAFEQGFRAVNNRLGRTEETAGNLKVLENLANNLHARHPDVYPTTDAYYASVIVENGTDAERDAALAGGIGADQLAHFYGDKTNPGLVWLLADPEALVDAVRSVKSGKRAKTDAGAVLADAFREEGVLVRDMPKDLPPEARQAQETSKALRKAWKRAGLEVTEDVSQLPEYAAWLQAYDANRQRQRRVDDLVQAWMFHLDRPGEDTLGVREVLYVMATKGILPPVPTGPKPANLSNILFHKTDALPVDPAWVEGVQWARAEMERRKAAGEDTVHAAVRVLDTVPVRSAKRSVFQQGVHDAMHRKAWVDKQLAAPKKLAHLDDDLKGLADFTDAQRTVLKFFKTANAETLVHEPAHLLEMLLPPEIRHVLEEVLVGRRLADGERWPREASEAFARQYAQFLRNGRISGQADPALGRAYAEVAESMHALLPEGGEVNEVVRKQLDLLHADAPTPTVATVGGYGDRAAMVEGFRQDIEAAKRVLRGPREAWLLGTIENIGMFLTPARDVMERSLKPVVRKMLRMETGEWDTLNRDISTAVEANTPAINVLYDRNLQHDLTAVLENGAKPNGYELLRTVYIEMDKTAKLTADDITKLDEALIPQQGDTLHTISDRLWDTSRGIVGEAGSVVKRGGVVSPLALRKQGLGRAYFAQVGGLLALHDKLLREGIGVGMTITKIDAVAANAWTSGWDVPGVDIDRGRQTILNVVDPTAYRAPLEALVGADKRTMQAMKTPFASAGEIAVQYQDITRQDAYVPQAVLDRLAKQIEEVRKAQDLDAKSTAALQVWKQNMTMGYLSVRPWYHWVNHFSDFEQVASHIGISEAVDLTSRNILHNVVFGAAGFGPAMQVADKVRGVKAGDTMKAVDITLTNIAPQELIARLRGGGKQLDGLAQRGAFGQDTTAIMDAGRRTAGEFKDVIIRTKDGREYSARSLNKIFAAEGVLETQGFGELVRALQDSEQGQSWLGQAVRRRSQVVQDQANFIALRQRVGLARILVENGLDPYAAAKTTVGALYDYKHSLHPVEQGQIWGYFNPFWTYKKNNTSRAMRDILLVPGALTRVARLNQAEDTAAKGATFMLDRRDAAGFDTEAMKQDDNGSYEAYTEAMALLKADGLSDTDVFNLLRTYSKVGGTTKNADGKTGGDLLNEVSVEYWTDDPKASMLPSYLWERVVVWRQLPRYQEDQDFYLAGSGTDEGRFDVARAFQVPVGSNLDGLDIPVVTAMMLADIIVNQDAGAYARMKENLPRVVGDPTRSPALIAILQGLFGVDMGAYDRKLSPGVGELLHRYGTELVARRQTTLAAGESPEASGDLGNAYVMPANTAAWLDFLGGGLGAVTGTGLDPVSLITTGVAVEKTARALDAGAADVVGGEPLFDRPPGEAPDNAGLPALLEVSVGQKSGVYSKTKQEGFRDSDVNARLKAPWPKTADDILPLDEQQTGEDIKYRTEAELRTSSEADIRRMAHLSGRFVVGEADTWDTNRLVDAMISNGTWLGPRETKETWVEKLVPGAP